MILISTCIKCNLHLHIVVYEDGRECKIQSGVSTMIHLNTSDWRFSLHLLCIDIPNLDVFTPCAYKTMLT